MPVGAINYWAILIAAAASFVFGGIWYGLLSSSWMEARGLSPAETEKAKAEAQSPGVYAVACIAELIMAWMFAGVLLHLTRGGVAATALNGLISGIFLWFGFIATTIVVNYAFQGARRSLMLIDAAHWLGVLLIQGAILGWWGVR
ncbi:MAG TPA: DUF1761 domain-containing protein [Hyphomicrobiaceae bacterium]|jgi:hypothetical protein|nr:DUF1761 domain-containing protein [Hyphomicrobiaceae bacterium]